MGFLSSLYATHPTLSPCSHQRSALSPRGSATFACLPACLPAQAVTTTHGYSALVMSGSFQCLAALREAWRKRDRHQLNTAQL